MDHHFNTEIAKKYGVPEAIMLHNICFWQHKNTVNNKNFHDGRYWTYNSVSAFGLLFDYLSDKLFSLIFKQIETKGCVVVGRYIKMKIDRTKWYSANLDIMAIHGFEANPLKREMQLPNKGNAITEKGDCILPNGEKDNTKKDIGITEKVEPIPDNKPNKNSNNKLQIKIDKKEAYAPYSFLFINQSFKQTYLEFLEVRKEMKKIPTLRAEKILLKKLATFSENGKNIEIAIESLENSIVAKYPNVYQPKVNFKSQGSSENLKSNFEKNNEVYQNTQKVLDSEEYQKASALRKVWVDPLA